CISSSGVYTLLTDTKLRKALGKKRDQIEVISDAHGLNVRLSTSGSITFFYRYRWNGKAAQLTIGDYPTTSLSQARER
ncbi:Arm DNA-binding domain-containing protein, partial [Klebsiella pneumoniae]